MASFNTHEISEETSEPIEIFKFLLRNTPYLWTSAEDQQTVAGLDYDPIPIRRGSISHSKTDRKRVLSVQVPTTNALAKRFIITPPGPRCTLQVFRVQRGDATKTPVLIYDGVVKSVKFPKSGLFADFQVQSKEAASSRSLPRYTYAGVCGHLLYDLSCKVDPAAFTHFGTVTAEVGDTITISGLAASGIDMLSGYVETTGGVERRQVLAQSSDVVTMLLPFEIPQIGATLSVLAGCDHILTGDCHTKFDNDIEFGGAPYVPKRNPFSGGLALLWAVPMLSMLLSGGA